MHTSVFGSAHVLVHGQHFVYYFWVERRVCVLAVGVAQVIPTRTDEGVQSIGVAFCVAAAYGAFYVHKFVALGKRRFAVGAEFHVFGQFHGQIFIRHGYRAALGTMYNGNGCAPVSLTGYQPVAQPVIYFVLTFFFRRKTVYNGFSRLFRGKSVVFEAVYKHTVLGVGQSIVARGVSYYHVYRQIVFLRESVVARIMRGYAHYRARAVG